MPQPQTGTTRVTRWLRRLLKPEPTIDYRIDVPVGWKVQSEPDSHGFQIIEPPSGEGRLVLTTVVPRNHADVTEAYALDQAQRGIGASGLPIEGLELRQMAATHFAAAVEGFARGEHVMAAVHVFPGRTVIAWFHSPDPDNPNNLAASRMLSNIKPG